MNIDANWSPYASSSWLLLIKLTIERRESELIEHALLSIQRLSQCYGLMEKVKRMCLPKRFPLISPPALYPARLCRLANLEAVPES